MQATAPEAEESRRKRPRNGQLVAMSNVILLHFASSSLAVQLWPVQTTRQDEKTLSPRKAPNERSPEDQEALVLDCKLVLEHLSTRSRL